MHVIEKALKAVVIGNPSRFENLEVFPLLEARQANGGAPPWLSLDEALAQGTGVVTEVSEAGHVPELAFENRGGEPILLLDGEELVGARQNRILNVSILVGARRTIVVPVSCVEQGRWSYRSRRFTSAGRTLYAEARAQKMRHVSRAMRVSGERRSDQSEIWASISGKAQRMAVESRTQAMADIFQDRAAKLEEYARAFSAAPRQVGAVFAVGGRVHGLELFDSPASLAKYLGKVVASYALDAIEPPAPLGSAPDEGVGKQVAAFLDEVKKAVASRFPGVDLGEDVRLESASVAGGALVADEKLVHLVAFRSAGEGASGRRARSL